MAFTVTEISEIRADLLVAYRAVIKGKSYTISTGASSRTFTRNDIDMLKKELQYWDQELDRANAGAKGLPTRLGTPIK